MEDTTKETVSMLLDSKAKSEETHTIVDRPGIAQGSAPTRKRARVRAKAFKESVTTAARRAIPQGNAPKAKKEGSQR